MEHMYILIHVRTGNFFFQTLRYDLRIAKIKYYFITVNDGRLHYAFSITDFGCIGRESDSTGAKCG